MAMKQEIWGERPDTTQLKKIERQNGSNKCHRNWGNINKREHSKQCMKNCLNHNMATYNVNNCTKFMMCGYENLVVCLP